MDTTGELKKAAHDFWEGGGELGELTRDYDWTQTSVGDAAHWPCSLRTMVSMILSSRFPMFLWWGDDLVQFYNDAYRPSLGNSGKHPRALGQKGRDCWPEIWDIIYPLIQQVVTTGKATWSEDQLVPINRNGKIEDVYWTFGYSPVRGDSGRIEGVLVVCTETTGKVENLKRLEAANKQFRDMIMQAPVAIAVFRGPDFIAETVNDAYLPLVGKKRAEFAGKPLFETLPETRAVLEPLAREVVRTGIPFPATEFELMVNRNGVDELCYFNSVWEPLRENDGTIDGFIVVAQDVTEQVVNRKKIEESEVRFRTMAEGTDVLIVVTDETSAAIYFNKAWAKITGRTVEGLLKYGWLETIHPEDKEQFVATYLTAFTRQEAFGGEIRILNKDGVYRWLLANGQVRYHPDGSFAGHICSCIDITERKHAEKAFEESEQRLRALVESAPFPIGVYTGREMRIALVNQSIMDVWDKGNDLVGKLYREVLPELGNQAIYEQLDTVFTTGIAFHARNQRVDLVVEGRLQSYFFNYSFTPLYDAAGKVYGVMNTAADVTDLNLAKQKVEENEKSIRNTILKAPVAMCIFRGAQHVVEIANERMVELWGKQPKDVLNRPIFEGLPEAKGQGFEELLDKVITTGETAMADSVPVTLPRNGKVELVYVNFVYEAYREADGVISGIIAVATDVTAQVLARIKIEEVVTERTKELADANTSLKRSNAELAQFAYIASHDLQEPLRKISTFAQMLENSLGEVNERSKNYLQKINTSSGRMLTLIRDVLAYSQLTNDIHVFERVDLAQVVAGIQTDFELLIEQKEANIVCTGLPVIEAIPLQMSQLFTNLISNALKFTKEGVAPVICITGRLMTTAEVSAYSGLNEAVPHYRLVFTDNGIGFNQEYAEQIFNIFQRLHGKSEYAGTGIGLALCRKIAQNHHGYIYAKGSSGSGAEFDVLLPEWQVKEE